jgi:protein-tyrosine phosphatase
MNSIPKFVSEKIFELAVDGKVPIIAHPERNVGFQARPDYIYEYVQRGSLMQINEGSLRSRFGEQAKALAFKMIENKLAHFVASDGHKTDKRTVTLLESYQLISDKFGNEIADELFYDNPLKAIQGEKIINYDAVPLERENKQNLWGRLKALVTVQ